MKVKFGNIDNVERFIQIASEMQSGIIVKCGSMESDAKSPVGMLRFNTDAVLTVTVVEPYENEEEELEQALKDMGVFVC